MARSASFYKLVGRRKVAHQLHSVSQTAAAESIPAADQSTKRKASRKSSAK